MFMNELGESCHPSTADICRYSGLDKKTVLKHVAAAREAGWIDVSQHGYRGQKWKRQEYAARWPDRDLVAPCQPDDAGEGGGAVPPRFEAEKVVESAPEGGGTEGSKVVEHVHQDKTSPENIPNTSPVERDAREHEGKSGSGKLDPSEVPGRADFEKRVARFCNGNGFTGGVWKNWDKVAFGWIAGQFAKLTAEERAEAERWRDAYLLDCRDRKTDPQGVGVFLRDKAWRAMDAALLERAEKLKRGHLAPEERAQPEGFAKFLGPVGMAMFFAELLVGERQGCAVHGPFVPDSELRDSWPALWRFRSLLRQKDGTIFGARWHGLKTAMEAVPQNTAVLAAWKQAFADHGWLWLAEFDRLEVVFCPAGGPERLSEFEAAVRGEDDAGGREAAE